MEADRPVHGLAIEIDRSRADRDPRHAGVVAVALADGVADRAFVGAEAFLLARVDEVLAGLAPTVLVTAPGALPVLADRAQRLDVPLGLRLLPDPGPGGVARGRWHDHTCLEVVGLDRAGCDVALLDRADAGASPAERARATNDDPALTALAASVTAAARLARARARGAVPAGPSPAGHRPVATPPPADARPAAEVAVG